MVPETLRMVEASYTGCTQGVAEIGGGAGESRRGEALPASLEVIKAQRTEKEDSWS